MPDRITLTRRDRNLLDALSHGLSNKEIATMAGWTTGTAKQYVEALMQRVGIHSRSGLVGWWFRNGGRCNA